MTTSRRQVLAALAAAGGAGALTGGGTSALLGDEDRYAGGLTTGVVDLVGEYWLLSGPGADNGVDVDHPDGVVDGPRVQVPIGPLDGDDDSGSVLLRFALPQPDDAVNNPARLWLRTACPPANSLGEFLQVRVAYADADGRRGSTVAAGSLREVADALRTGYHLDPDVDGNGSGDGCLSGEIFVLVEYDVGGYVGTGTTELPISLAAVQCRNGDGTTSPFSTAAVDDACEGGSGCECCRAIGKVEVAESFQPGTTYWFDEGLDEYGLAVTAVDGDAGVAFELVSRGSQAVPPLCEVQVKGGPVDEAYVPPAGAFGTGTTVLDGAPGGVVYAPENPNSGKRYAISYVLVKSCAPVLADGTCPQDATSPAASVDRAREMVGPTAPDGGVER